MDESGYAVTPLVSCIMPTANRAAFLPDSIACFLAQDFESRELVVLDSGAESIEHLLPEDARIRYQRVPAGPKLGELRNRACEMARGTIIVHWDDDDWYPSDRITRQMARLGEGGIDLCASSRIYFLDSGGKRAWEYCSGGARPWLAGSSFAYRRALWERHKFQAMRVGEDATFAGAIARERIADLADPSLVVATMHARNTSPKRPVGTAWKPTDVRRVLALKNPEEGQAKAGTLPSTPHPEVSITRKICVGVYSHADAGRLAETLKFVRSGTHLSIDLSVMVDGADKATKELMDGSDGICFLENAEALGAAAAFNRLLRENKNADVYVFLESGSLPGPFWLERLCAALDAHPGHGLAGPTTNMAWSMQGEFRNRNATSRNVELLAREAAARFGGSIVSLAPLYCLGDFCFAVKRAVVDRIGGADEAYGLGPCWEMDFATRASRAGFGVVWARGAYVFRQPFTPLRDLNEKNWFETNKAYYQRKFCGQLLGGARRETADHCRGDACPHFAPAGSLALEVPLSSPLVAGRLAPHAIPFEESVPLASCIMPTHGRSEWVLQSIRYFQRQTYPKRELIIVDDSAKSFEKELPCDPRIRYVHRRQRMSIGAKRNLACEMARGEFIAHWDDDDWYGPTRLAAQVAPIAAGEADITALAGTPFLDVARRQFWTCTPAVFARMFAHAVHGGTLVYARRLFGIRRFPDASIAEDAAFLHTAVAGGARLRPVASGELFIYVRHGHNAWQFACGQAVDAGGWSLMAVPGFMYEDLPFYHARVPSLRRSA